MEIEWTDENRTLIASTGHVLCLGGPGSGKTTIALLKAEGEISKGVLRPGQRILFLSFARATIARVEEHAAALLKCESRRELEITTYHGFAWSILRSHGYLLTSAKLIKLLSPPDSAALLSSIDSDEKKMKEKQRLFVDEGLLDFDVFASFAAELLRRSSKLRSLVSRRYPIVVLDEFQDTDSNEWRLIQELGRGSYLIALADPEQRIYDFRGASPARIAEFVKRFSPNQFDFRTANYRSSGTDICVFGNDLLSGTNKGKTYSQVAIKMYPMRRGSAAHLHLKIEVLQRRKVIIRADIPDWSLAVLVPTRKLMLEVSDYLAANQKLNNKTVPAIDNEAALDAAGPALAAGAIAGVLSGGVTPAEVAWRLIDNLSNYIRGRKGGTKPSDAQLGLADGLDAYLTTGTIRGSKRAALADECLQIANARMELALCGDPRKDWLLVRELLERAESPELRAIAQDARFLKFLNRGTQLRSELAGIWRRQGNYEGAPDAVSTALVQEHFASSKRKYQGIHVMTVHKSKGKQFTEVIIYEGAFQGRILRQDADERTEAQARLSLRVGVTRAERYSTILTPESSPCPLL